MLLAEDPFDLLIERLRELPPGDRRGVLARLSSTERRRVEAALLRPPLVVQPSFAADIAERIGAAATHPGMTAATREVLSRLVGNEAMVATPVAGTGPSLFGRLGDLLRRR
ncbi:hypothetical protein [Sphingomonas sp. Leaf33]|uniref:hypothetical protein n=1 Tax=Sphingomonas sp. Leaf33 TaxID=1736215 RepID=UPI000AB3E221|nr:hypothetical protein [Sphingomonas sp. Leaf33]